MPPRAASRSVRPLVTLAASLLVAWPASARAATADATPATATATAAATATPCEPPHTRVMLVSLTDATDHAWQVWTGAEPATLVTRLLADSLRSSRGREVMMIDDPRHAARRTMDDGPALDAAREVGAEIVVTGTLNEFTQEDRREAGKFSRWGVGAPDARSRARVRVTLRVLDANNGTVIIETGAVREKASRSASTVDRSSPRARASGPESAFAPEALLGQALGEVLADLVRTVGLRLETRWRASVESVSGDECTLDTGTTRGHFVGQRLEVWRSGIETYDENLVRLSEEARVGALVVTAIEAPGRVRARVLEGDARPGDGVRACSQSAATVALRR